MSEKYTLILRSSYVGTAPNSGTSTSGYYNVDWMSFLPKRYKKFLITSTFRTANSTENYNDTLFVYCSLVRGGYSFDTKNQTRSSLLCVAKPINDLLYDDTATDWTKTAYYTSNIEDSWPIMVDYPPENYIYLQILDITNAQVASASVPDYILSITFEPIKE